MSNINTRKHAFENTKAEFGQISNIEDLINFVVTQINIRLAAPSFGKKPHIIPTLAYLKFEGRYSETVSNSHCAPIGYPTNWCNKCPDVPSSYPGFNGRLWLIYSNEPHGFGSDRLHNTGLNSGTGGYGTYSDCFRFSDDYKIEDTAFTQYCKIIGKTRSVLRGCTDSRMQFYPDAVKRLRKMYPLSWDSKLYIEDFSECLGKIVTHSILTQTKVTHINFSYASPEFINDMQNLTDNFDLLFSSELPKDLNFALDDGPFK